MPGIADFRTVGFFPLQDHVSVVGIGRRQMLAGARIVKMTDGGGNASEIMTEYGVENGLGTLGDIHPWMFWQVNTRDHRAMGSWAQSFAGIIDGARARGGGPTTGNSPANVFPVAGDWQADQRFVSKGIARPAGLSQLVKGSTVIVMPAMHEHSQVELVLPADGRLWAPSVGGPGECGTLVCDLQPDATACMDGSETPGVGGRHARLQSMMRVVAMPIYGSAGTLDTFGNGIAWNLSKSQQEGLAGLGMVWAPMVSGGGGPITPGGNTARATSALGDLGQDEHLGEKLGEFGAFVPRPTAAHGVALMAQIGGSGPIHAGHQNDKHRHGEDRDGNPINAAHISTNAYFFRDQSNDGPLLFEGDYPNPPPLPLISRTHLSWQGSGSHPFAGGGNPTGYWRWWSEVPYVVPTTGGPRNQIPPRAPGSPPPTGGPTPGSPGAPGAPGSPPAPPPTGGPRVPRSPVPGGPSGGPITPNPANPAVPGGRRFPGYPITGGGPAGPIAPPPSGPAPGYGPGEPSYPGEVGGPSGPITGGGPRGPIAPLPSGPAPGYGPGEPRFPGYLPTSLINPPPITGQLAPGEKHSIGSNTPEDRELFLIHHPMMESYGALAFRPQLWVSGYANLEHGPSLGGDLMREEESFRPQVIALRSWGAQSADGLWDYRQDDQQSRARGGITDGGIFYCPPEFEPEDYFGLGEAKDVFAPSTQGFVTAAPGVAFALGTPVLDGGLAAASVTIAQTVGTNQALDISQLDSTRVPRQHIGCELDQATGEVVVSLAAGGTQAIKIPRGTTAQRPSAIAPAGGMVRVNSSGANDVLEFWDVVSSTWIQTGGAGGTLTDGDKGDVTVSGSGSVWTIDNDAVTYVKMQNVSATDKVLGRSTAGAGDVEEIACTATGRSIIAGANAAAVRTTLGLVIGTNVLAYDSVLDASGGSQSAGDMLVYSSGAWVLIPASSASLGDVLTFGASGPEWQAPAP